MARDGFLDEIKFFFFSNGYMDTYTWIKYPLKKKGGGASGGRLRKRKYL